MLAFSRLVHHWWSSTRPLSPSCTCSTHFLLPFSAHSPEDVWNWRCWAALTLFSSDAKRDRHPLSSLSSLLCHRSPCRHPLAVCWTPTLFTCLPIHHSLSCVAWLPLFGAVQADLSQFVPQFISVSWKLLLSVSQLVCVHLVLVLAFFIPFIFSSTLPLQSGNLWPSTMLHNAQTQALAYPHRLLTNHTLPSG